MSQVERSPAGPRWCARVRALALCPLLFGWSVSAADLSTGIGADSVAAARAALHGKPGTHERIDPDGWTLIDEAAIATQWAFAPASHLAYPAVVRRVVKSGPRGIYIETRVLCEAAKSACSALMQEVQQRNAVIDQRLRDDPDLAVPDFRDQRDHADPAAGRPTSPAQAR